MPWIVERNTDVCPADKPWAVRNQENGDLRGCHSDKEGARGQQEALYSNVPEGRRPASRTFPGSKWKPAARLRELFLGVSANE